MKKIALAGGFVVILSAIFFYSQFQAKANSNIGQCMGDCASEQGICISQCQGDGQCIGNCGAAHGRCVSRCN